ncbi:3-oxoacyl-(acyl carrier protein) synthase [marine gamma proteobacterium HTCC2080]|jgi:beta-ketodecanoyl-[acyl-carrier-protein] synthase|nr:3-oxoacyl-(acyl carrier protein) synthase [marine gamma proteobacterium HTCC2080]MDG1494117.1 beta-ketoacyl-ACP synthase III [Luminiphilus sp.]MDG1828275.1 beta-ketoacyl-ACP synthase III [Luminiphilus sp.]MDG2137848.1 beta-ketoacyl-ACP synthase III [Luminiphilus sp.]MDG2493988.1 beta-ketoacyl-ACP synthase III [Luminiphilus sp.]
MKQTDAVISGTGLFTPEESVSNDELVTAFNAWVDLFNEEHSEAIAKGEVEARTYSSTAFIEKASGIKSRYVLNKSGIIDPQRMAPQLAERPNSELSVMAEIGVKAARQALEAADLVASDLDAVIVAASNMQRAYPAMAVEIQDALGAKGFAFDMNVACSSATFGIQQARDSIRAGSARRILMVNPEICTGHLNFRDRDAHFIFGDVATAVVIEATDVVRAKSNFEIIDTRLQTIFSNNIRNNFGFMNRADERGIGAVDKLFVQEGRKVFKEVCPAVAQQINEQLADLNLQADQLSRLWLHQANRNMNDLIARRVLGREPTEKESPTILDAYANTSSAGSIIAFHLNRDDLNAGELGVLCSFGAGYSIGSVVLRAT